MNRRPINRCDVPAIGHTYEIRHVRGLVGQLLRQVNAVAGRKHGRFIGKPRQKLLLADEARIMSWRRDSIYGGVTQPQAGSRLQLHRCGTDACRNRAHLQKQRLHTRIGRCRSEDAGLLLLLLQPVAQDHGNHAGRDKKHDGRGGEADIAQHPTSASRRGHQVRRRHSRDITGSGIHACHHAICVAIQAGIVEHFRHRAGHVAKGERIVDHKALGEHSPDSQRAPCQAR